MDFELIFTLLFLLTLCIVLLERWVFKPRRIAQYGAEHAQAYRSKVIDYAISLFPVIAFVFVLRSFVVEPFRIPSGSMLPTLESGDMILVNKFGYGIRLPVIDKKLIPIGSPERGDVAVFRYPVDPSIDFIKRIVGLPGDIVRYEHQRLFINGQEMPLKRIGPYVNPTQQGGNPIRFQETIEKVQHDILLLPFTAGIHIIPHPYMENCRLLSMTDIECKVPEGHYFAMGDNRNNSEDSRFWGFVPDKYLKGKAFFIWLNFGDFSRIGTFK